MLEFLDQKNKKIRKLEEAVLNFTTKNEEMKMIIQGLEAKAQESKIKFAKFKQIAQTTHTQLLKYKKTEKVINVVLIIIVTVFICNLMYATNNDKSQYLYLSQVV
ncbi:hypothetical protein ABFX02_13G127400 [Erythranthe guttata]